MAKSTKIDDVKRPEKVTPAATSRPLVVTNRPFLSSDPMVVPAVDAPEAPKPAEPIARTAKTIVPVSEAAQPEPEKPAAVPVSETPTAPEAPSAPEPPQSAGDAPASETTENTDEKPEESPVAVITEPSQPGPVPDLRPSATTAADDESTQAQQPGAAEDEPKRDAEAEAIAEETAVMEAKTAREQELEQLIASGKYRVPINAVQRKRSRMYAWLLFVVAILLAAVLVDAALDAGLVTTSLNVPHTHFFSNH